MLRANMAIEPAPGHIETDDPARGSTMSQRPIRLINKHAGGSAGSWALAPFDVRVAFLLSAMVIHSATNQESWYVGPCSSSPFSVY